MSPPDSEGAANREEPGPHSSEAGELLFKVAKHVAEVDRCMKRLGMMPKEEVDKIGLPANLYPFREALGGKNRPQGQGSGSATEAGQVEEGFAKEQRREEGSMMATVLHKEQLEKERVMAAEWQLPFDPASAAPFDAPPVKAQRLRGRFLKTEMCRHYRSGCRNGDLCPFAHGPGELRERPCLQKTVLCNFWRQGLCTLDATECNFAHGPSDLRSVEENVKTHNPPKRAQFRRDDAAKAIIGEPSANGQPPSYLNQNKLQTWRSSPSLNSTGQPGDAAPTPPWPNQRLTRSTPGPAPQQLPLPFRMATAGPAAPGDYLSQTQQADDDKKQPPSALGGGFGSGQSCAVWHLSHDLLEEVGYDDLVDVATFGDFSIHTGEKGKDNRDMEVFAPKPTTVPAMRKLTPSGGGFASSDAGYSGAAPSYASNQGLEVVGHLSL